MRRKRSIAWIAAGLLAASAVVVGSIYNSQDDGSVLVESNELDPRGLLLRPGEYPAGDIVEASLEDAGWDEVGHTGMSWSPTSCAGYLAEAVPGLFYLDGWVQQTDRRSPSFRHDNFFTAMAIKVPGGADLASIQAAAETCRNGTVTLESNGTVVTGSVSYQAIGAPARAGAETLSLEIDVSFDAPKTAEEAAILTEFGYGDLTGDTGAKGIDDFKQVQLVALGEVLLYTMAPGDGQAEQLSSIMYNRAIEAGAAG